MRILVTGAGGFIGGRTCLAAAESGHSVTALVRPRSAGRAIAGADRIAVGQLPFDVPRAAFRDVEAVVHAAAVTTSGAAGESPAVNHAGTLHLLRLAAAANVRRFVFLSTQSVFSPSDAPYAVTKRHCEEAVKISGLPHAILRPGLVYGPGAAGLFSRMRATVRRLPVLPLLGGGKAIVQGIEVSDLCAAILRCLDLPADQSHEFNLGDPEGVRLSDFLQALSRAESGRTKPALSIPLAPVKAAVAIGEALRLPLPISKDNVRGMETVQRMETRDSLDRLGLALPSLADGMARAVADPAPASPQALRATLRPVSILLVGAGKIGLVHALNLSRRAGIRFAGIVDRNPSAFSLYKGLGFDVPFHIDLDRALDDLKPDGAIVATPAATHPALTRLLAGRGVAVLVEKPAAISAAAIAEYRALLAEASSTSLPPVHVGYMAAQYPHLARAKALIEQGAIGWIRRVDALALQSHIMAPKPLRWEMVRAQSGGGALINFAGHLLTMLRRLFGEPQSTRAALWSVHSAEVEDAGAALLDYGAHCGGFHARTVFSWSMPGYPTPENRVLIEGETGTLDISNSGLALLRNGRTEQWWSQRADDVGYNAGPDYTGAGFAAEHRNFARAIRAWRHGPDALHGLDGPEFDGLGPMTLSETIEFEESLLRIYDQSEGPGPALDLAGDHPLLTAPCRALLAMARAGEGIPS